MALVDKMKAQAAQLAQKAQEAGKAGQSKLADAQARRRADGLLRELGAAFYAQKTGTAKADTAGTKLTTAHSLVRIPRTPPIRQVNQRKTTPHQRAASNSNVASNTARPHQMWARHAWVRDDALRGPDAT
jgi:hypothetical protein